MDKTYIWDTGALTLFFAGHNKAKIIMKDVMDTKAIGYIPRIILAEYYYKTWKDFGKKAAQLRTFTLRNSKLKETQLSENEIFTIGELKVKNSFLSMADCVVISSGLKHKGTIITTETRFSKLKNVKVLKLDF